MPPRLVYIVTHPMTARHLLRGQLRSLRRRGFEVILVTSPGPDLEVAAEREGVRVEVVPMAREMAPWRDLRALTRLTRLLRRLTPDLVNAGTPKAGLLGMLAARRARVPVRIYTLRGLRLETARGWRRAVLKLTERLACRSAHRVVAVSDSLRSRCLELGLAPPEKVEVLGPGSSNGVDVERFAPRPERRARGRELARKLGIPVRAPVVGFVGRLTRDKGIGDLLAAFDRLRKMVPETRLLLLGEPEPGDPPPPQVQGRLDGDPRIHRAGFVPDTAPWYPVMDVVAFPSRREGFPNVPLEAAAAGLPTVGYRVTGTVDAVEDGVTGRLVAPEDTEALAAALAAYLTDPKLGQRHGEAARQRAEGSFRRERVWERWAALYRRMLEKAPEPGSPSYPPWLARALDLAVAVPALLLSLPLLALSALAVRLTLGSPVIFRQLRPGRGGEPFTLWKLRTMRDATDPEGRPLPDARRLTRLGRFLRATSLDELPSLWNVLRGDLRLVGPRPLLMEYLSRYTPQQARRHEVPPGLTGWAQIHGRNALGWEDRFRLDVWYVDHRSLLLDLRILAVTLARVLLPRGIRAEGHATMPKFEGSADRRERGSREARRGVPETGRDEEP